MIFDLLSLKTFLAVVETGSFLAASQVVGRSNSAVSVQIKKLEETIGARLFERDSRATRLTEHGKRLLPHARRMIETEAAIVDEFSKAVVRGSVRLGVPDDVVERFPMQALKRFSDAYPGIVLTLSVGHTPDLLRAVDSGRLDLSVITHAITIAGIERAEIVHREREVWAKSRYGLAAEKSPLPITLWEQGWAWYQPVVDDLDRSGIDYALVLQCENISARRAAIAADLAIGPLPVSQLHDDLIAVDNQEQLPALPEYRLGLKMPDLVDEAVAAVGDYLRRYFAGIRDIGFFAQPTTRGPQPL